MTVVKDFVPRPAKTEPFVHWASTDPNYSLSSDGKFWVRASDGLKFCNMSDEEHENYRQMRSRGHSIDAWCLLCDDALWG